MKRPDGFGSPSVRGKRGGTRAVWSILDNLGPDSSFYCNNVEPPPRPREGGHEALFSEEGEEKGEEKKKRSIQTWNAFGPDKGKKRRSEYGDTGHVASWLL